jgi:hypothetical protein
MKNSEWVIRIPHALESYETQKIDDGTINTVWNNVRHEVLSSAISMAVMLVFTVIIVAYSKWKDNSSGGTP